jgi:F-type H+-transporting ATPase subunit b
MQHEVSTAHVLINVAIQIINILIFFLVFKYFFADKILEAVEERKKLLEKIKKAEEEYQRIIAEAEEKKKQILQEAEEHKKKIIEEAEALAKQKAEQIIKEAQRKADEIIENAKAEAYKLKKELEDQWAESVKYTAKLVVNKLFEENKELQDQYLQKLIEEFRK